MNTVYRLPIVTRAFSLIETAIVLGVVGLIIGGIWIGASSVRLSMQTNDLNADITTLHQNLWNTYKGIPIAASTITLAQAMSGIGGLPGGWTWTSGTVVTDRSGVNWSFWAEFANRPKLQTTVGSSAGLLPAKVCHRLLGRFFSMDAFIAGGNKWNEFLAKSGGMVQMTTITCGEGDVFQIDFYRQQF